MNTLDNLKKILFYPIIFELTLTLVTYVGNYASLQTSELQDWLLAILTILITYDGLAGVRGLVCMVASNWHL
jgi:fructose-specific phosphotransferase system IIC component